MISIKTLIIFALGVLLYSDSVKGCAPCHIYYYVDGDGVKRGLPGGGAKLPEYQYGKDETDTIKLNKGDRIKVVVGMGCYSVPEVEYHWFLNNSEIADSQYYKNERISWSYINKPGYYKIYVNESSKPFFKILVIDPDPAVKNTYLREPIEQEDIKMKLYPNPVSKQIHIELDNAENAAQGILLLVSESGKEVYRSEQSYLRQGYPISIPIAHLSSGMYYAVFETKEQRIVKKVIKN